VTSVRLLLVLCIAGCVDQPIIPRAGLPTLDDAGADSYMSVSAGFEHTCALTVDGTAFCWGSNEFGQLGAAADTTCRRDDRRIPCRLRPVQVGGGLRFSRLSAGGRHTCGIDTVGALYCWGDNLRGELGEPSVRSASSPIPVRSTEVFIDVAVGQQHSCALRTDGVTFCWGANERGQIGNANVGLGSAVPDSVRTTQRFVSIEAGALRNCGRTGDGATFCWGQTWATNLSGSDVTRPQTTPSRVQPAPLFKSIGVGTNTTCGIAVQGQDVAENSAFCWESNSSGGMGDSTVLGSLTPRAVQGGVRFVAISSGAEQTCGIAETGFVHCWGANSFGQLGISPAFVDTRCGPTRLPCRLLPVRVSGWRVFAQLAAGQGNHACGITLSGNIYCWGAGGMGQRGDGRTLTDWAATKTAPPTP
jgi:alpha-tubulin suppressor-like RCC1 family protein